MLPFRFGFSMDRREARDGRRQFDASETREGLGFRVRVAGGDVLQRRRVHPWQNGRAQRVMGLAAGNAQQPGVDCRLALEGACPAPDGHERVLQDFFGGAMVGRELREVAQERPRVTGVERVQRGPVARRDAREELPLVIDRAVPHELALPG